MMAAVNVRRWAEEISNLGFETDCPEEDESASMKSNKNHGGQVVSSTMTSIGSGKPSLFPATKQNAWQMPNQLAHGDNQADLPVLNPFVVLKGKMKLAKIPAHEVDPTHIIHFPKKRHRHSSESMGNNGNAHRLVWRNLQFVNEKALVSKLKATIRHSQMPVDWRYKEITNVPLSEKALALKNIEERYVTCLWLVACGW